MEALNVIKLRVTRGGYSIRHTKEYVKRRWTDSELDELGFEYHDWDGE